MDMGFKVWFSIQAGYFYLRKIRMESGVAMRRKGTRYLESDPILKHQFFFVSIDIDMQARSGAISIEQPEQVEIR